MPYNRMSEEEWRAFLANPVRPAVLATARRDGRPHAAPVWYEIDGDELVFTTGENTVKGRNIRRDPRVTMVVQDDEPPFSFVSVEGEAELSDDMEALRQWATRIGGRYMGAEVAERFGARNAVAGELLVRVTITKVTSASAVAD